MRLSNKLAYAAVSLMAFSAPAFAQDTPSTPSPKAKAAATGDTEASEEIVITGTLIKGAAPVGSNSITLGEEKLTQTGALSANGVLASVPQVSNYFNNVPEADLAIAVNQIQIARPNLRNISGNNAASAATLILVDGHRVATAGVNQASIDPDLLMPSGAIGRVDVVTEGGSATYGADAVAGVINYVTRRKFDGVKVGGRYGFAKNYWQWDANAMIGKQWDNGSAWIGYSYAKNDALYGRERGYIHNLDYSSLPYRGLDTECVNGNLAVNTVFIPLNATFASQTYALPGLVAGTSNRCDNSQNATRVPRVQRHNLMAGLSWDFGDSSSVDVRAYWNQRKSHASSVITGTVSVGPTNPYTVGNLPAGVILGNLNPVVANRAAVSFSLEPLLGLDSARSDTMIKEYGVNAEYKHKLGESWEVRLLANWSKSDTQYNLTRLNPSRLGAAGVATTAATAFNPFNVVNNNAALIADLMDNEIAGIAKDNLVNLRAIVEGKLFELPGGDARMAVGYEYMHDKLEKQFQSDIRIGTLGSFGLVPYSRNVNSVFGELNLPLIAQDNRPMLTVGLMGRYDKYSDFGSTFNPKVGVTFEPVKGFILRGNWGTSFTAPTPVDQLGSLSNTIGGFPIVAFTKPGTTPLPGSNWTIAIQGSQAGLTPQKADTWSLGTELNPTKGLRARLSYYNVTFTNILGTPTPSSGIFTDFPNNVAYDVNGLTPAQATAFFTNNGASPLSASLATQLTNSLAAVGGGRIVELVDFRVGNFGTVKVSGVDGDLDIKHETGFGSIDAGVHFNLPLTRKQQRSPTAAIVNDLQFENSLLLMQSNIGLTSGGFRAQATWNHRGGYNIVPTTSVPVQSRVGAFNTVDLFFKYDVSSESTLLKDVSLTLNINNVADASPPLLLRNNPNEVGYANGFTLGRLIQFGISKKF